MTGMVSRVRTWSDRLRAATKRAGEAIRRSLGRLGRQRGLKAS